MNSVLMKEKLHRFIETVEEKRMKAIYAFFEKEIEQEEWDYTEEFKAELDRRYNNYMHGGHMISAEDAKQKTNELVRKLSAK